MMQVTDDLIRSVVQDVLTHMRGGSGASPQVVKTGGRWGVFESVDEAVAAAKAAQEAFEAVGIAGRKKAVDCVRRICMERAEELGIGRGP